MTRLCKQLPEHKLHKLFFDNWFTTLPLLKYLKMKSIHAVGTIRVNCISSCPMLSNKELEKAGGGTLDYRSYSNSGLIVAKWVHKKFVQLCSNMLVLSQCKRFNVGKKQVPIQCPSIVTVYNKSIGGVDLADTLIALYEINVKIKRWKHKSVLSFGRYMQSKHTDHVSAWLFSTCLAK